MPESAEVKIFTDNLNKEIANQSLKSISIIGGRFVKTPIIGLNQITYPLHNIEVRSKGKFLFWKTNNPNINLCFTLGMTGSFGNKSNHSAIKFEFDNNIIYFNDPRRFGTFRIFNAKELNNKLSSLGWDILQEEIPKDIISKIRKFNKKTVAEIMMNQSIFSGCGNYLKNECCYEAKINPLRTVISLNDFEIMRLCHSLQLIVKKAYNFGGATIATFKDMHGNNGKFFNQFKVYGRKKDPAGNTVNKIITKDGRSTFYVNEIQI